MYKVLVFFLAILTFGESQAQEVRVVNPLDSNRAIYPNEPSICIDRTNPANVVVGANIDLHYFSQDYGRTWTADTFKSAYGMWGDPVLHASPSGTIFLCHLSNTPNKKGYEKIDRIVVQQSADGGAHFDTGVFVGLNGKKMQDKPWLSEDVNKNSPQYGNLYMTWTEFDKIGSRMPWHRSRIQFSWYDPETNEWSKAKTISDKTGNSVDDDKSMEGATTAVNDEGHIFCVWAGKNNLYFDKSLDGGSTWGKDTIIARQEEGWTADISHVSRANGLPFLVCDNSNGPNKGRLYVLFGDKKGEHHEVYLMHSDDQGENWSDPISVSSENHGDAFLGNICLDSKTGKIYVIYYDRSGDEDGVFAEVILASSSNGGDHFDYLTLSDRPIPPGGKSVFSGDYIDLDASNGLIATAWQRHAWASYIETKTVYDNQFNNPNMERDSTLVVFAHRSKRKAFIHVDGQGQLEYQVLSNKLNPMELGGRQLVNVQGRGKIEFSVKKKDQIIVFQVMSDGNRKMIYYF